MYLFQESPQEKATSPKNSGIRQENASFTNLREPVKSYPDLRQTHIEKVRHFRSPSSMRVYQLVKSKNWKDYEGSYQKNILSIAGRTRHAGDATYGKRARFMRKGFAMGLVTPSDSFSGAKKKIEKKLNLSFIAWGLNREAQHLVPASVGFKYGIPDSLLNSVDNMMMLVSGRHGKVNASPAYEKHKMRTTKKYPTVHKVRVRRPLHVGHLNRIAHPDYNTLADNALSHAIASGHDVTTTAGFHHVTAFLRNIHKTQAVSHTDLLH